MLLYLLLLLFYVSAFSQTLINNGNWSVNQIPRYSVVLNFTSYDSSSYPDAFVFQSIKASPVNDFLIFETPLNNTVLFGQPVKVTPEPGNLASAVLPPFPASDDFNTVYHLVNTIQGNYWQIWYSTTDSYNSWVVDSGTVQKVANPVKDGELFYNTPGVLSQPEDDYKTVFAQTILSVNETWLCSVYLKTKGILRAVYWNGDYLFSDASAFVDLPETFPLKTAYIFKPGESNFISIIGTNINPTLIVEGCTNITEIDPDVNVLGISRYAITSYLLTSDNYTYWSKYSCPSECEICSPDCQQCKTSDLFLTGNACLPFCVQTGTLSLNPVYYNNKGYCDKPRRRATITNIAYNSGTSKITFTFKTEYPSETVAVIIYSGKLEVTSMFTRAETTTSAIVGKGIYAIDSQGILTGTIDVSFVLNNAMKGGLTFFVDRLEENKGYLGLYDSYFLASRWIEDVDLTSDIEFNPEGSYLRMDLIAECSIPTALCQFSVVHDGAISVYTDGTILSTLLDRQNAVGSTVVLVNKIAYISLKLTNAKNFSINYDSTVKLWRRKEQIFEYHGCIDDEDDSVIKHCFCHVACQRCYGPGMTECAPSSCHTGRNLIWDPIQKVCTCDSAIPFGFDDKIGKCDCFRGSYFDSGSGSCVPCDSTCERCTGPADTECFICEGHRTQNPANDNACECNYPWKLDSVNSCSSCDGFTFINNEEPGVKLVDCVATCPAHSTTDIATRTCTTCFEDSHCSGLVDTPYCSLYTTHCVAFKVYINTVNSRINPTMGVLLTVSVKDHQGIYLTDLTPYTFIWSLSYPLPTVQIGNTLRILPFDNDMNYPPVVSVKIVLKHSGGTYSQAEATYTVNQRPYASIYTSPSTGKALSTIFNLTAVCSDVEDDRPFTVQWNYITSAMGAPVPLQQESYELSYIGQLPMGSFNLGIPGLNLLFLQAVIRDANGLATTELFAIPIRNPSLTTSEIIKNIEDLSTTNPDSLSNGTLISDVIQGGDAQKEEDFKNPCNGQCSFHGDCVDGACVCDAGYVMPDCSYSLEEFEEQLKLKRELLDYVTKICTQTTMNNNYTITACFHIIESLTSNILMSPSDLSEIAFILAQNFMSYVDNLVLDKNAILQIALVVNNFANYHGEDCNKYDSFGYKVISNLENFLNKITVFASRLLEIDGPFITFHTDNFKIYVERLSTTNLNGKLIKFDSLAYPTVQFPLAE